MNNVVAVIKETAEEIILPRFKALTAKQIKEKSGPGDLVTIADIEAEEKVRLIFFFYAIFLEKNKGFARILSREALGPSEQNVIDSVNQFYERLELSIKQLLSAKKNSLQLTAGQSAHLITTIMEGMISRFIRNKFKEVPSGYIENYWSVVSSSIFKN